MDTQATTTLTLACPVCGHAGEVDVATYGTTPCPVCGCGRVLAGGRREGRTWLHHYFMTHCPHCPAVFAPIDVRMFSYFPLDCPGCGARLHDPALAPAHEPEDEAA